MSTRRCEFVRDCTEPAAYLITYVQEFVDDSYVACNSCTAMARANDPLEYIEAVRSLGRPA